MTADQALMPCSCGGTLAPHEIRSDGQQCDVSDLIGIPAFLTGQFGAAHCERCGKVEYPGRLLEILSKDAVLNLLALDRRLSGREARFLRKEGLEISTKELAERLGISSRLIKDWESAESLNPQQDFDLRSLAVGRLLKESRLGAPRWKKEQGELLQLLEHVLAGARSVAAPKSPPPLRLAA